VWEVSGFTLVNKVGCGVLLCNLPDAAQRNVVRVRGLGHKASVAQVRQLLDGFQIEPNGVYVITGPDGRATRKGEQAQGAPRGS
jgi:pyruvate/2-oxoglutarate dehydrogenase complex dihydrolipoamide acyltransferase (E2) component